MIFTQIRHATCKIEFGGTRFLVDPVLYEKNTLDPIKGGTNEKNPLVDISADDIKDIDVILLTHTHKDHFDPSILEVFGKDIPIVCSGEYKKHLSDIGFCNIKPIKSSLKINGVGIELVKGRHGTGIVGKLMGNSYGFVLKDENGETVYITGDTIWCKCVEKALEIHVPKYVVAFAGSATINNKHITMDAGDIQKTLDKLPKAKVIAVHMEAWNHCKLSRLDLKNDVKSENLFVPYDSERLCFNTN